MKKFTAFALAVIMLFALTACGEKDMNNLGSTGEGESQSTEKPAAATEIYFLNSDPEIAEVYERIARDYKEKTGVSVKVVTAANNTYEQTLTSELAKSDPPTIFQISGHDKYRDWADYCADLRSTSLYSFLSDKTLAINSGDGIFGIPYVVEGYGIIYNEEITDKYFKLKDKNTSYSSMDEINNFEKLKALVEDMQAHKSELGIDGVFASTSLSDEKELRWTYHLANVPFFYEFSKMDGFDSPMLAGLEAATINFDFADNFKQVFDLYVDNSVTDKKDLSTKSTDDSISEFALGKAAMMQNDTNSYRRISKVSGNVVKDDDIKMLPIYTGADDEEKQGLCIGTESYLVVNSKVSSAKQQASIDFLEWLFSSDEGKKHVTQDLGFISPFNTFDDDERVSNPLAREMLDWMEKDGIESVPWVFTSFPSEAFNKTFSDSLNLYAQGTKDWDDVVDDVKNSWKDAVAEMKNVGNDA